MSTFNEHKAAIISGEVSVANIRGIRLALNAHARRLAGLSVGMTSPDWTDEEVNWLHEHLGTTYRPSVCQASKETGLSVLNAPKYKRRLSDVRDIIDNLSHFELVGFGPVDNRGLYHVPEYRAVASNGDSFKYRVVSWQAGGDGPELI